MNNISSSAAGKGGKGVTTRTALTCYHGHLERAGQ